MSVTEWCRWCGKQESPINLLFLTLLPTTSTTLALILHQFSLILFAPLPPTLLLTCPPTQTSSKPWRGLSVAGGREPTEVAWWLAGPGTAQGKVCCAGKQSQAQIGDVNTAMRTIAPNKSLLKSYYHAGVLFDMLHAGAVLFLRLVFTRPVRVVCCNFTESVS